MQAWDETVARIDPVILDSPASLELVSWANTVNFTAKKLCIRTKGDIHAWTSLLLHCCAHAAQEIRLPPNLKFDVRMQTPSPSKLVRADASCYLVDQGRVPHRTVFTLENMLPAVMQQHMNRLDILSVQEGFTVNESALSGNWRGIASLLAKVCYNLLDPPHHVARLSDGTQLRYLCRGNFAKDEYSEEVFLLAPPIKYTDPRLYPLLLLPLINPDHFNAVLTSRAVSCVLPPPTSVKPSGTLKFHTGPPDFRRTDLFFRAADPLPPSSPLHMNEVVFTQWTTSPAQADVFLGTMGGTKVVLKMGDPDAEHAGRSKRGLWAEADLYPTRLKGLAGVLRLLAKGWVERLKDEWCPALLMESLGKPISESNLDELSDGEREQLANLVEQLKERGIVHCDIEPRNIVRSGGRVGLVDFGEAEVL
ncbi:hypothetical protein C8R46DRAFT_1225700 [Mycena filopes]|nr:hypothetical protein C8R46DRAFT_1225700 [Mycena filopes]